MDEMSRACRVCGAETVPGAIFCHRCGNPLENRSGSTPSDQVSGTLADEGTLVDEGNRGGVGAEEHESATFGDPMRRSETAGSQGTADDREVGAAGPGKEAGTAAGIGATDSGIGASADPNAGGTSGPGTPSAAGASDGFSSASRPAPEDDPGLARALRGDYRVRIGDWMSRGWLVFTRDGGLFIGFAAITWLIFWFAPPLLIIFLPLLVSGHLTAALKVRTGERLRFSDFWLPFNDFLPLLLAWLVWLALFSAGLVLTCGIVAVYLGVAYQYRYLLILDRHMDFWEALEASRRATTNHNWPALLAFGLLMVAINVIAFLVTASIGIIVSLPLTSCVLVEAYADIFGVRGGVTRPEPLPGTSQPASI